MARSEVIGALVMLPGLALAVAALGYLAYAETVCDPLYETARLYDMSVMAELNPTVHKDLGGVFEPPPRPALGIDPESSFARSCH